MTDCDFKHGRNQYPRQQVTSVASLGFADYVELDDTNLQRVPGQLASVYSGFESSDVTLFFKNEEISRPEKVDRPLFISLADDFEVGHAGCASGRLPLVLADGLKTPLHCDSRKLDNRLPVEDILEFTSLSDPGPKKPKKRRMLQYQHSYKVETAGHEIPDGQKEPEFADGQNSFLHSHKRSKKVIHAAINARRKIMYHQTDDIELAVALGLPTAECTPDRVNSRIPGIKQKLRNEQLSFSVLEEFDIHTRAEMYIRGIAPDRDYCVAQGASSMENFEDCSLVQILSEVSCVQYGKSEGDHPSINPHTGGERKRRRHSCGDVDCYVVQPTPAQINQAKSDHSFLIPEGLCLLRPPNKLVELVAQAINDSPDGMLQVQQVYVALQNKYPYFRYMDKASMTSWRSSIRHALYQKWFRKIAFCTELINTKGCYWAINRRYQPREWTLPPTHDEPQDDVLVKKDDYTDLGINLIAAGEHHAANNFPFLNYTTAHHVVDKVPCEETEELPVLTDLTPIEPEPALLRSLPPLIPRPRDPDPMLSHSDDFHEGKNSQEIEISSESSNDSRSQSVQSRDSGPHSSPGGSADESLPVIVFEAPSSLSLPSDDADYLGSLEWISSLNNCPTSTLEASGVTEYHAPLLAPYCVSYSTVPPIELADPDMDPSIPIYIQAFQSHEEHW